MFPLRRIVDFFLLLFVVLWFNWLISTIPTAASTLHYWRTIVNYTYFSLLQVTVLVIIFFGILGFITVTFRWEKGLYWQLSTAEASYLYVGLVILSGFFRQILAGGGRYGGNPLWLTFIFVWIMFGGWFWLYRSLNYAPLARSLYTSIYAILILLFLPLAATAFSFWDLTVATYELRIEYPEVLLAGTAIMSLIFIRIYTHCLKRHRKKSEVCK